MRFLVGILALCTSLSAVAAEAADPSVEVIPPDVAARTLPKDTPIELEVHLKAGDSEVTDISISWFSNNGINAELANETPAELRQLAPKSEHSWRLKLTGDGRSVLTDSTLHIRLAFDVAQTAAPADGVRPAPTHRLLYTSATIKPPSVVAEIELAKAVINGAPDNLAHERPGQVFIIVTNEYSKPLTVTRVRALGPSYICMVAPGKSGSRDECPVLPPLSVRILPGQATDIVYGIKARSEVVPGKYPFLAALDVVSDDNLTATVMTAPQNINVVVLGESDILKFLGIPSLLFLPGVLMLIAWQFLWSLGKPDDVVATYRLKWNTSDFWIIAIAVSLLTALIYPPLTSFFLSSRRNFVAAYGLLDFELILGFSLIVSGLVFGAWRGVTTAWQKHRARKTAELIPSEEDTPLQILEKLARLKKDNLFEQYVAPGIEGEQVLLLEPWSTAEELWLVPPAEIKDINGTDPDAVDAHDRLVNDPPPDAASVLAKIRDGIAKHWWTDVGWRSGGEVRHPIKVKKQNWNKSSGLVALIQSS